MSKCLCAHTYAMFAYHIYTADAQKLQEREKLMHPADAPPGSLRALLIKCMTSLEPVTKRLANELVWALCQGDGGEEEVNVLYYYYCNHDHDAHVSRTVHAIAIG